MCNNSYEIPKPLTAVNGAERRSFLLETNSLPTQTEVRREMGPKMTDIFFEDLSVEGKVWLGLIPPLVGPDEVWISPDSRLEEKARMTPVPEPKATILKAFCHKNVLKIGENIRQIIEEKHKQDIEEALKFQAFELEEECAVRIQNAVEKARKQNEDYLKEVVGTLMEHFDQCFKELRESTVLEMRDECSLHVKEEKEELAASMFDELQSEISKHETDLLNNFNEYLKHEIEVLEKKNFKKIRSERNAAIVILRETIQKYEKLMCSQKTEMEASSVVDICRAINYERQQCNEYSRLLERTMQLKINELQDSVTKLKKKNAELLGSSKESVDEEKIRQTWKQNFQDVICEFQKFINFSLKSAPAQAEYLLRPDKLMEKFPEATSSTNVKKLRMASSFEGRKQSRQASRASSRKVSMPERIPKPSREYSRTFSYAQFKKFASNEYSEECRLRQLKIRGKKPGKIPKAKKEKPIDRNSSFYNLMVIVGEHEKIHAIPVEQFVDERIMNLLKICQKNPEVAKMMLGCP